MQMGSDQVNWLISRLFCLDIGSFLALEHTFLVQKSHSKGKRKPGDRS